MKKTFLRLLIHGVCLMAAPSAVAEDLRLEGMPLGERLVYKITWLGVPVGTGSLWVKEKTKLSGREVFHVIGQVETNKVLRTIFPMHDEIHSWIDAKTFQSLQFEKDIREIRIKAHEIMSFDEKKKKGYFKSFTTGIEKEFNVIVPVHDVLSAFYWTRRQKLVPGKSLKTVLTADQKDWYLTVRVIKKESIKFHGEKINTLRVEPDTWVQGEAKLGKAWMHVTEDSSRIPLRITYKAPFGRVVGTLQSTRAVPEIRKRETYLTDK
jgi:hypothetical protein